jgi:dTDP-4-dehydrorhamnose reductase
MKKKILILGASGMIGNTLLRYLSSKKKITVFGTVKSIYSIKAMKYYDNFNLIFNVDVEKKKLTNTLDNLKPDIVINCIGLIKHLVRINSPSRFIYLNSFFPHYLVNLSSKYNFRLIHISSDCVFSGLKGNYNESDLPDATDLYGRSKLMGEVNYSNSITLRTSVIGHELNSSKQLLEWFLSQAQNVIGYQKAIYSGITTLELARVIYKYIIPNKHLKGLYNISSNPISKYDLLLLINKIYSKKINIASDHKFCIDRSLNSYRFKKETGFKTKSWEYMIQEMYDYR